MCVYTSLCWQLFFSSIHGFTEESDNLCHITPYTRYVVPQNTEKLLSSLYQWVSMTVITVHNRSYLYTINVWTQEFPNVFFAFFYPPLFLMFVYCRCKTIIDRIINRLQKHINSFYSVFIKYIPYLINDNELQGFTTDKDLLD